MCKNEQEVRTAIEQFRRSLTPEICARYISKLEKVNKDKQNIQFSIKTSLIVFLKGD